MVPSLSHATSDEAEALFALSSFQASFFRNWRCEISRFSTGTEANAFHESQALVSAVPRSMPNSLFAQSVVLHSCSTLKPSCRNFRGTTRGSRIASA
eukprot:1194612-Prorocentrum_minimum.AAC.3